MTKKLIPNKCHVSLSKNAGALMLIGAALGGFSISATAQERNKPALPVAAVASTQSADLEKAFWICDHAATTHGVDGGMAIACGAITQDLKVKKFNGDFDLMLVWWRQNKPAEHQALVAAGHAVSGR